MIGRLSRAQLVICILAGLAGATGVILAAISAHANASPYLPAAANFLLFHATAVLAVIGLSGHGQTRSWIAAAVVLLAGASLFSAELATLALTDQHLFPMAAPIGGTITIIGWLSVSGAAIREFALNL